MFLSCIESDFRERLVVFENNVPVVGKDKELETLPEFCLTDPKNKYFSTVLTFTVCLFVCFFLPVFVSV